MKYPVLNPRQLGYEEVIESVEKGRRTAAYSLTYAEKLLICSYFKSLVVLDSAKEARAFSEDLSCYCSVAFLPAKADVAPAAKALSQGERTAALTGFFQENVQCVVTSTEAFIQTLCPFERFGNHILSLKKGECIRRDILIEKLIDAGYVRVSSAQNGGEFSVKGDILDIVPPFGDLPVRIDFFDDEIEALKQYDPTSLLSVREIEALTLPPADEMLYSQKEIDNAARMAAAEAKKLSKNAATFAQEKIDEACLSKNVSFLAPFLPKDNLFSYAQNRLIIMDNPALICDRAKLIRTENSARMHAMTKEGKALPSHGSALLRDEEIAALLSKRASLSFMQRAAYQPYLMPQEDFTFSGTPMSSYYLDFPLLVSDIKTYLAGGSKVLLFAPGETSATAIAQSLTEEGLGANVLADAGSDVAKLPVLSIVAGNLPRGFYSRKMKLAVIGSKELVRNKKRTTKKGKATFTVPSPGDYVVHEAHGIGKCLGIEKHDVGGVKKEFIAVEYSAGTKLFVPVDQMDRLSRYTGADHAPKLSKIGGKDFEKVKERVRSSIRKMAFDLLKLYRERAAQKGFVYSPDTPFQKEFEESFEYEETPDQLSAVSDIKEDMESGKVMDRLICGDVGYGKTEVALRAIFKTAMDAKQSALLCPTTILARQHYNTMKARFSGALRCALLTRECSVQQTGEILKSLKEGKTDVIVGTHKLLSKNVEFQDLGLLVLDEEQKFGVEHKEKIKNLKKNVNVLTLSATPIPRTLNMALSGLRDISVLETPPARRLPIDTYVTEYSDTLVKDALEREIRRGGQAYILFNRVEKIASFAAHIQTLVPEAQIRIAHGQMDERELEKNVTDFYDAKADILVCTTIIENGIDLPNANTLIVIDSDKLGLSSLYQLRGRVGRSDRLAAAYFTIGEAKAASEAAEKRLAALLDYTELGSGVKIALRDLEIRGAGNLIGKEQSGHMESVGYDMYCKLLAECVAEAEGKEVTDFQPAEVKTPLSAYAPDSYIASQEEKMKIYARISALGSKEEAGALKLELTDIYGALPAETENLIVTALVKNLSGRLGVEKAVITDSFSRLEFADNRCFSNQKLLEETGKNGNCYFSVGDRPQLTVKGGERSVRERMEKLIDFLEAATKNT